MKNSNPKRILDVRNGIFLILKWEVLISRYQSIKDSISHFPLPTSKNLKQTGFSSLAFLTVLGLFLAVFLALVGTGAVKLPGNSQIPVSPLQVSNPVEDDTACNDPYNADCEKNLNNDPEDLTPAQIQSQLEKN